MAGRNLFIEKSAGGRNLFKADNTGEPSQTLESQPMRDLVQSGVPEPKNDALDQITGALPNVLSGAVAAPIAGIAEASAALHEGTARGREAGDFVRDKLTIQPNAAGREGLENLGEFVDDVSNLPYIKPVVDKTTTALQGDFIRDQLLGVGLPPEVAGTVAGLPQAALEAIGVLLSGGTINAGAKGIQSGVKIAGSQAAKVAQTAKDIAVVTPNAVAKTIKELPRDLLHNAVETGAQVAGKIADSDSILPSAGRAKERAQEAFERGNIRDQDTAGFKLEGNRVVDHERAVETIRQGFSEQIVANIKASNAATRNQGVRMVVVRDRGLRGEISAARNRASDIVGESIGERLRFIKLENRKAGARIDRSAGALKGKPIDVTQATESLKDALDGLGVKFDRNNMDVNTFDFKESAIAQLPALQTTVKRFIKTLAEAGEVDAYKVHIFKRQIDNIVDYGKNSAKPITQDVDNILKSFRHDLNQSIRDISPEYAKANDLYSKTIESIKNVQDLMSRKYNVFDSDEQLGILSRRVLSNAQSAGRVRDAMDELDTLARELSGSKLPVKLGEGAKTRFSEDMMLLVDLFVELDDVAGIAAKTSHAGSTAQGLKQGFKSSVMDVVIDEVKAVRSIDPKSGLKAMRELLKEK